MSCICLLLPFYLPPCQERNLSHNANSVNTCYLSCRASRLLPVSGYYINTAAMNIIEQMSLLYECASFGYMPKSGNAGSCGRLI
ncbi:Protein of unknown function DUF3704 containing protein [Cricetulus griseus]|uniref:Uncharacterized protein n=1 Tax=Cricetulus griseus TaxID=10029 RepID=A0A061HZ96_CRIGR|nr:Protein of unknown function DUF3704 containing protein [Cricetulus griseus]